ncbi:uncharacterized protein BXZ73DRAFT_100540 [Epithele typhae]|uniref:uncharacterized protein n=1 Tax=Epithele typhae TaxID=378194 RepID=UPI002008084C|nr:uncharacterized protein BXZ73DRAFT_100540 [Epithele typhae]KAH9935152.1 hypothetical protein BXZ73DRAFT_100540 [Epithele typhae]
MATVDTLPFPAFAGSIPSADRASLSGLSDVAIREYVVAKAEDFPAELLSEVLSHCWHDMRSVRLMHVCRVWRATALKTPQLWADAAAAPGTQLTFNKARIEAQCQDREEGRISFAASAIKLSSPTPLRLKIHFLPNTLSQTLSSHSSRLVDLLVRLQSAAQFKSLCALLANGVPNPTVLGIAFPGYTGMYGEWLAPGTRSHYDDIDEHDDHRNLSKELTKWSSGVQGLIADTPRLQTLRCVPIDLVSHLPHQHSGPQGLMRLDLCMENRSNTRLRPDDEAPGWVASPVDLPALWTLVFNLNGNINTAQYLDLISISSSVSINLMQSDPGLLHLYQDLPSRHTPLIQSRVQSASTVHIYHSYDRWEELEKLVDGPVVFEGFTYQEIAE